MDNLQMLLTSLTDLERKRHAAEIKKFQNQAFTSKNDEAVKRHFFQEKIVESLTTTFLIEHKEHVQIYYEAYMLYSKGLDVLASKRLRKAIEIAESIEDFQLLFMMYNLEMNLALQHKEKLVLGTVKKCAQKKQLCIEKINLIAKYEQINMFLRDQYNTNGFVYTPEIESYLANFIAEDVEGEIPSGYPVMVKLLITKIRYLYFLFIEQEEKALVSNEEMVELTRENIGIFSMDDYYNALFNLCFMTLSMEQEEKFLHYFSHIELDKIERPNLQLKHYYNTVKLRSSYFMTFKKYKEGLTYFDDEVTKALKENKEQTDFATKLAIYSEHTYICYHNKEYDRAMDMLSMAYKFSKPGFRDDVINCLKVLEIVLCYHLGLSTLLVSKCNSYIKNYPESYQPHFNEYHFINFLVAVNRDIIFDDKMQHHFLDLKSKVKEEDEYNYTYFTNNFSIYDWMNECIASYEAVKA